MWRPSTDREPPVRGGAPVDVLGSRLGRKTVLRLILTGLIPLVIFAIPLYLQTRTMLYQATNTTLHSYTRLAKGQLFRTLETAQIRLEKMAMGERMDTRPAAPFTQVIDLDANMKRSDGRLSPWEGPDELQRERLGKGQTVLTQPFWIEGVATVAFLVPVGLERARAGVLDPEALWQVTGAGNYGPHDALIVLDEHGTVLATSNEQILPGEKLFPSGLPAEPRASGDSVLSSFGSALWSFSDLWLTGAYGGGRWGVIAARQKSAVTELPETLLRGLFVFLIAALCVIVVLSFREARSILGSLARLAQGTIALAEGRWDVPLDAERRKDDELGDLMNSFHDMAERLRDTHEEQVRLTREAMVGRLAAMVAHQINTPLAAIRSKLELVKERSPEFGNDIGIVEKQVDRINTIVKALLGFAKVRTLTGHGASVRDIVGNVVQLFQATYAASGIELEIQLPESACIVSADADDIQEILVNLLENAREAMLDDLRARDGTSDKANARRSIVSVRVEEGRDVVNLYVEDNGGGIEGDASRIFEPFFTTKTHGTGLGLAITRRICEAQGGSIVAENRPEGGVRFHAVLPATS